MTSGLATAVLFVPIDMKKTKAHLEALFKDVPQLLGLGTARVFHLEVAALGDNLLGSKGSLGVLPSGVFPPGLDLLDFLCKEIILGIGVDSRVHHVVCGHDGQLLSWLKGVMRQSLGLV